MKTVPSPHRFAAVLLAAALLGGCATAQRPDPLEKFNRGVFAFNETVDQYAIAPAARVYRDTVPELLRQGVTNFFNNLRDAWSAVNLMLQGRPADGISDVMRVSANTVLGLGGLVDWATPMGLPPHYEDFGQTLGVWGFPSGAYLVLPLLGPSTVRDTAALPVDIVGSPQQGIHDVGVRNSLTALRIVDTRANLLGTTGLIDEVALDKYSFIRDAYLQRRRGQIDERGSPDDAGEDYDPDAARPKPPAAPASGSAAPAAAAASAAGGDGEPAKPAAR